MRNEHLLFLGPTTRLLEFKPWHSQSTTVNLVDLLSLKGLAGCFAKVVAIGAYPCLPHLIRGDKGPCDSQINPYETTLSLSHASECVIAQESTKFRVKTVQRRLLFHFWTVHLRSSLHALTASMERKEALKETGWVRKETLKGTGWDSKGKAAGLASSGWAEDGLVTTTVVGMADGKEGADDSVAQTDDKETRDGGEDGGEDLVIDGALENEHDDDGEMSMALEREGRSSGPGSVETDVSQEMASVDFLANNLVLECRMKCDTAVYVTVMRTCRGVADAFAYGQRSGVVTVVTFEEGQPHIHRTFKGNGYAILDLDWSTSEELRSAFLLSVASDQVVRVWSTDAEQESCVLECDGACCARFMPGNCSTVLVGSKSGELLSINCSTGRSNSKLHLSKKHRRLEGKGIGISLLETNNANLVFAALETGQLCVLSADKCTGKLEVLWNYEVKAQDPSFTSLSYTGFCHVAHGPALLVSLKSGECTFLSVPVPSGKQRRWSGHGGSWRHRVGLEEVLTAHLEAEGQCTCVALCPKLSLVHNSVLRRTAELVAVGDERGLLHVWCVDSTSDGTFQVTPLHTYKCFGVPVADLSWCYGEDQLLVSSTLGEILVWTFSSASLT